MFIIRLVTKLFIIPSHRVHVYILCTYKMCLYMYTEKQRKFFAGIFITTCTGIKFIAA